MATRRIILPWDGQPQEGAEPASDFTPRLLWHAPGGRHLSGIKRGEAGTFSGSSAVTLGLKNFAHNGTSQHETWVVNEPNSAYPVLVGGSFVVTQTSTANQTAVGVGGAATAGGLYGGVGQYTAGTVGSWLRMAISGADGAINGPAAVVGQRYNVVRCSRSATDHVMYVNGVRYSSSTNTLTPGDSWKNFSIGASVRDTTPVFYGRQAVHLGFFDRVDPGEEWMRAWSLNEWLVFEPQAISVLVAAAGGGGSAVGLCTEADTAIALGAEQRLALGLAVETGASLALAPSQRLVVGIAVEVQTALLLAASQAVTVGLAGESDAALALGAVQGAPVGIALEADSALALVVGGAPGAVGVAVETDTAAALPARQVAMVGQAAEINLALALSSRSLLGIGLASEFNLALALAPLQSLPAGLAGETDSAFPLALGGSKAAGVAVESDTAFALSPGGSAFITVPAQTLQIMAESRLLSIAAERRSLYIPYESRTLRISP